MTSLGAACPNRACMRRRRRGLRDRSRDIASLARRMIRRSRPAGKRGGGRGRPGAKRSFGPTLAEGKSCMGSKNLRLGRGHWMTDRQTAFFPLHYLALLPFIPDGRTDGRTDVAGRNPSPTRRSRSVGVAYTARKSAGRPAAAAAEGNEFAKRKVKREGGRERGQEKGVEGRREG